MSPARPTLRCLRGDLQQDLPSLDVLLYEVEHPLIRKAVQQFADPAGHRERIRAIDDQVLYKIKAQRWRGAVWTDDDQPWLVAAGWREDGSLEDFYQQLTSTAQAQRATYNRQHSPPLTTDTDTHGLLPTRDDRDRLHAEEATRLVRQLRTTVRHLVRASLLDGQEHSTDIPGARLGVEVRADRGHETYVAICIIGSITDNLIAVVLGLIPGCDRDGWYPELATSRRPAAANEHIWSNLMDPHTANALWEEE
ncbi:MAG: hypothetical protein ACRDPW_03545 [Mycobacteriales bacterium]